MQVGALYLYATAVGLIECAYYMQQCAFAGTRGADNRYDLALADIERDIIYHREIAVPFQYVLYREHYYVKMHNKLLKRTYLYIRKLCATSFCYVHNDLIN